MSDKVNKISVGEESISNSLRNIFVTQPGTIPGHPEFGTNLGSYLFEQIDPLITKMIEAEIKYAVDRWEPRVKITDIEVKEDADYNRLTIKMKYYIDRDPYNAEHEYIFSTSQL